MVKKINSRLLNIKKSIFIALSLGIIIVLNSLVLYNPYCQTAHPQPYINDDSLIVESIVEGFSSPTSMKFVDDNDILVLEKDGHVRHVVDGVLQEQLVLQIPVSTENERGLLGI